MTPSIHSRSLHCEHGDDDSSRRSRSLHSACGDDHSHAPVCSSEVYWGELKACAPPSSPSASKLDGKRHRRRSRPETSALMSPNRRSSTSASIRSSLSSMPSLASLSGVTFSNEVEILEIDTLDEYTDDEIFDTYFQPFEYDLMRTAAREAADADDASPKANLRGLEQLTQSTQFRSRIEAAVNLVFDMQLAQWDDGIECWDEASQIGARYAELCLPSCVDAYRRAKADEAAVCVLRRRSSRQKRRSLQSTDSSALLTPHPLAQYRTSRRTSRNR